MHLFSPTEIYFCLWIHRTKFTKPIFKSIQMISENRNEGEIAKSRRLRRVEGDSEIWNISSSNSQNQIFETKMVRQWQCTCHSMYLPKFSLSSFFSSPTTCCPRLPLCLPPLAWSIGSYAQGLWLSGSVDLVVCSCSEPAPVCLPSGPCAALWIYLGSGSLAPLVG